MAMIFLLGPGSAQGAPNRSTHLDIRKKIAAVWEKKSHRVLIMERVPDLSGENELRKFERLLAEPALTDIVVYWPRESEMTSTQVELVVLATGQMSKAVQHRQISLSLLHQNGTLSVDDEEFNVLEERNRTRYLNSVLDLDPKCYEWETFQDLLELADNIIPE